MLLDRLLRCLKSYPIAPAKNLLKLPRIFAGALNCEIGIEFCIEFCKFVFKQMNFVLNFVKFFFY